jgi:hypothetical protein
MTPFFGAASAVGKRAAAARDAPFNVVRQRAATDPAPRLDGASRTASVHGARDRAADCGAPLCVIARHRFPHTEICNALIRRDKIFRARFSRRRFAPQAPSPKRRWARRLGASKRASDEPGPALLQRRGRAAAPSRCAGTPPRAFRARHSRAGLRALRMPRRRHFRGPRKAPASPNPKPISSPENDVENARTDKNCRPREACARAARGEKNRRAEDAKNIWRRTAITEIKRWDFSTIRRASARHRTTRARKKREMPPARSTRAARSAGPSHALPRRCQAGVRPPSKSGSACRPQCATRRSRAYRSRYRGRYARSRSRCCRT